MAKVIPFPTVHDPLLDYRQLGNHWGVSKRTLQNRVKAGMPSHVDSQGVRRFRLQEVERWRDGAPNDRQNADIDATPEPTDGGIVGEAA